MPLKTYTIELQMDFKEDGKDEVLRDACRDAARTLLITARMLMEKRKPNVTFHSGDFIVGTQEMDLELARELEQ